MSNAGDEHLCHELDGGECSGHHDELDKQASTWINELGQEGSEEQYALGIRIGNGDAPAFMRFVC